MTTTSTTELPIRVGIFDDPGSADDAVEQLLAAGFSTECITVMCSDPAIQHHFQPFEHQDPAGAFAPAAALAGGVCGALLFGITAVSIVAALGAAENFGQEVVWAAGLVAMAGGGVVGGLVGAMLTRGAEKELANFYDQAVPPGEILVAAQQEDPKQQGKLARAEEIFVDHGVHPVPLPEG